MSLAHDLLEQAQHLARRERSRLMADACLLLQQRRHEADYDMIARLTRSQAQQLVRRAEQAFAAWERVRGSEEARAFLLLLVVTDRWKR